ncbi:MAG: succinate dehydrogenase cytochrome b subunit [Ignavibacteriales bacterium]|nr:succinate dehydrogenase cytochrome b subunit [Ignavibacteriales bacterium]MCB9258092.1 succinate dehydrogenase cytochrome b subunit [Ignavibacteriales bacterium]
MGWLSDRLNSSIGKKIIMATTGLLLILFLIIHLANNLLLFLGPEIFNENVARLEAIKPLVRVIELVLLLIFVFHIYNALKLYFENKKAKPDKYAINANSENSTFYSRFMTISGIIILIFLVLHLATFWREFNFGIHPSGESHPFYAIIQNAFANPIISIFYLAAMIILGFHLNHAFQSAFQTFGWRHKKYTPLVEKLGTLIALIMTIGFGSIPVFFYLASLGGN